jgi:hypothetical chaperone protein
VRSGQPIAYGIDFGTTNSSIAVAYSDRIETVKIGLSEVLPSIIYLNRDRNRAAGQEAVEQFLVTGARRTQCGNCSLVHVARGQRDTLCKQYRAGSGCQNARLISGIKSFLATTGRYSTHSWATDFTFPELVAVILRTLKAAADRATGTRVNRVVLGHPVVFVGAEGADFQEKQKRAMECLYEAAKLAGFSEIELFDEPSAAINGETLPDGVVLAADFGGGTFDVAVTRFSDDGGEVLALAGAEIGGEDFDRLLFDAKVAPALHLRDLFSVSGYQTARRLPSSFLYRVSTLSGLNTLLSDREMALMLNQYRNTPNGSKRLKPIDSILFGGYAYQFYRAIEDAKIALSTADSAVVDFHRPGIDLSIQVSRSEFDELIADRIQAARAAISSAMQDAGVGPEDVTMVLRTGGSSSIPAFVTMLEGIFSPSLIQQRPVYTTVVEGLASYAWSRWYER